MHLVNAQKGENWGAAVQEESSSQHVQPEQLTEECPCQKNHASLEPKHTPASTNPHPERELLDEARRGSGPGSDLKHAFQSFSCSLE